MIRKCFRTFSFSRVLLVLAVLLLAGSFARIAAFKFIAAPGSLAAASVVVVPPGSTRATATVLQQAGIISHGRVSTLAFRAAAWASRRQGALHAGEFLVPAHASLGQVLAILRFAAPVEHQLTIPEGLTAVQIAAIINNAPAASGHVAPPPEGAVLPQTYDYTLATPRAEILRRAEAAGKAALATAWAGRNPGTGLSAQAALTLASIVQEETPLPAELPKIAAVYENRLALGMKLQADPTVIYAQSQGAAASGQPITRADLALNSPYNTYVHAGLPPGPICAPGLAALNAVLHPVESKDLYFVATGNGGHVFSATYQQHLARVAAYRAATQEPNVAANRAATEPANVAAHRATTGH